MWAHVCHYEKKLDSRPLYMLQYDFLDAQRDDVASFQYFDWRSVNLYTQWTPTRQRVAHLTQQRWSITEFRTICCRKGTNQGGNQTLMLYVTIKSSIPQWQLQAWRRLEDIIKTELLHIVWESAGSINVVQNTDQCQDFADTVMNNR
jgi:hypothetical protein